jgi:hypothetical protein
MTASAIPIEIEISGEILTGRLAPTAIAASLLAQLPLTLRFRDHGQQEKLAPLPRPVETTGAPRGAAAPATTIAYYAPAQAIVLYYKDVGHFTGIMPVGMFDDTAALEAYTSDFTATIRRAR